MRQKHMQADGNIFNFETIFFAKTNVSDVITSNTANSRLEAVQKQLQYCHK